MPSSSRIPNTVVHAGTNPGYSKETWLQKNKEFYDRLLPTAEKCNVNILCENTTTANIGYAYGLIDADKILELIQTVNNPKFHVCWDFGHANCEPNQIENIKKLGKEIYAVHIHDNNGKSDSHLMPYCGTLDCVSVLKVLKEIKYDGYFTFECDGYDRNKPEYHGKDFSVQCGLPEGTKLDTLSRTEQEKWLYYLAVQMLDDMEKEDN